MEDVGFGLAEGIGDLPRVVEEMIDQLVDHREDLAAAGFGFGPEINPVEHEVAHLVHNVEGCRGHCHFAAVVRFLDHGFDHRRHPGTARLPKKLQGSWWQVGRLDDPRPGGIRDVVGEVGDAVGETAQRPLRRGRRRIDLP